MNHTRTKNIDLHRDNKDRTQGEFKMIQDDLLWLHAYYINNIRDGEELFYDNPYLIITYNNI